MSEFESIYEAIVSKTGAAVIFAGSGSDKGHVTTISDCLKRYCVPHTAHVASAHKQPDAVLSYIARYDSLNGLYVIIAVAGGTDALSGLASFHSRAPVISCPPEGAEKRINESCLFNPPLSSNAYILRADNTARFVAQLYAPLNPSIRQALESEVERKLGELEHANTQFAEKLTYLGGK